MAVDMEEIVNLCKRRGFVFPSAEIYGGFRSTYDYGPLGVNMLRNVKNAWWRAMVQLRDDVVGLDRMEASRPTTSWRSCTIERHQAFLTLRSIRDPSGP